MVEKFKVDVVKARYGYPDNRTFKLVISHKGINGIN